MDAPRDTWVRLGMVRMPAMWAALLGAVAAHAAILAVAGVVYAAFASEPAQRPPKPLYTMGQPIQVQLTDEPPPTPQPDPVEPPPSIDPPQPPLTTEPATPRPEITRTVQRVIERRIEMMKIVLQRLPDLLAQVEPAPLPPPTLELASERPPALEMPEPALAALPDPPVSPNDLETQRDRLSPPDAASKPSEANPTKPTVPATGINRSAAVRKVPTPTYPSRARRAGHEGTVLVEVEVLADGSAGQVNLHQGSGYRSLDRAALAAAKRGAYQPAQEDGRATPSWLIVPFEFKLKDR